MKNSNILISTLSLCAISFLAISCGGGGGGGDFNGAAQTSGRATGPSTGQSGAAAVPLANATVTVLSVLPSRAAQTTSSDGGTTDADGNYSVTVPAGGGAIVVNGVIDGNSIRISGLLRQQSENEAKDFNPATDIACQGYISALNGGLLTPEQLTNQRIQILEDGATQYLASNTVNFFDPASVTEAALAVRDRTSNGSTPYQEPASTTTMDVVCTQEIGSCADGFPICAELICDGNIDCADESDEDPNLCSPQ
jgi:hypothetical protein